MLSIDNITEIAYWTDYRTTINILSVLPQLNTNYFFIAKWSKMYDRPAIPFFTDQDNFLMMERAEFTLVLNNDGLYKNILYENDGTLMNQLERYSNEEDLRLFNVTNLQKQYIVICSNYSQCFTQFDIFYDAETFIEKSIKDNPTHYYRWYIVDMDCLVVSFVNVRLERKPNCSKGSYRYLSFNFKRYDF